MRRAAVIVCLVLAGGIAGCYHRVVSSKGLGGMGTTVQDPYRSDTAADRAIDRMSGSEAKPSGFDMDIPESSGGHATTTTGATYRMNGGPNGH
jgi:hypothetical protein